MLNRDYQDEAIDAVFDHWGRVRSTMGVLPTGTGKTHVIAGILHRLKPSRGIVIAHRDELIWQARDKIFDVSGLECEVEKAELVASTNLFNRSPVVVASVQTLISGGVGSERMRRFNPRDFGALIIDENHHSTSKSYRSIVRYFMDGNPSLKLFGTTATPDRSDEEALGKVYESVAFDFEILDMIERGWLVPIKQQIITIEGLDFSHIKTTAGDLNGKELAMVMESEKPLHGVAGAALEITKDMRSIVFTSSVNHAEMLCNIFNRSQPASTAWVCGKTPKQQRRQILEAFIGGVIQRICNCGVLTEGFDCPQVEAIIMAKPTKSRSAYTQMVGRATRPLPNTVDQWPTPSERRTAIASSPKHSCLIVDFTGNTGRHRLVTTADILAGNISEEIVDRAVKKAKKDGKAVSMVELLEDEAEKMKQEVEKSRVIEESRRAKLVAKVQYSVTNVDPFKAFSMRSYTESKWDTGKSLSQKQRTLLMRQGINPDLYGFAQGQQLFREVCRRLRIGMCSFKQANFLKSIYPNIDCQNMKRDHASRILEDYKREGRKPDNPAVSRYLKLATPNRAQVLMDYLNKTRKAV